MRFVRPGLTSVSQSYGSSVAIAIKSPSTAMMGPNLITHSIFEGLAEFPVFGLFPARTVASVLPNQPVIRAVFVFTASPNHSHPRGPIMKTRRGRPRRAR